MVRKSAQACLDWLDRPAQSAPPLQASKGRFWPQIEWQCNHPQPPAIARDQIEQHLQRSVPKYCSRLIEFARPAICLWPQRRADIPATASRFGGMPLAPPGWHWPIDHEEPLLFVGQINCADLHGLPGAEPLPPSGLLAFFGDHDAVTGCFPFDEHCVFYWPDVDRLVQAEAAIEPLEIFPPCALVPRPFLDLPHPDSGAVSDLGLNEQERTSYFDVWLEVRRYGIPPDYANYAEFSKLFGWPALVQNDLWEFDDSAVLLLQVDSYCNGVELHSWGPGGSLFYRLHERDLRARKFERCALEGQFT